MFEAAVGAKPATHRSTALRSSLRKLLERGQKRFVQRPLLAPLDRSGHAHQLDVMCIRSPLEELSLHQLVSFDSLVVSLGAIRVPSPPTNYREYNTFTSVQRHNIDDENKRVVGRNTRAWRLRPVAKARRDDQFIATTSLCADEAFVPSGDDLTLTHHKGEGL